MQVYVDAYICQSQRSTLGVSHIVFGGRTSHFYLELAYSASPVSSMNLPVFFFSSALRLQILVTMSGLSVGSEDGTQDLKQFTSWASSQVLVPAPSNTTCLQ